MATQPIIEDIEETETHTEERDFEAEAREMGWVPKDDFKGDPSRHVDAKTFVERGEEMLPLIKAQNKRMKQEIEQMRRDMKKASEHFSQSEKRAYERARQELEDRHAAAIEAGDAEAGRKVLQDLDKLHTETRANASSGGEYTAEDAEKAFDSFCEDNPWYERANLGSATDVEKDARLFADRLTRQMVQAGKPDEMSPQDFFGEIAEAVKKKYPQLSRPGVRPQARASDVAGGGVRRGPRGGKTFDDLPQEAQRMCDRWVKQGLIKNREDYVKTYEWDKQ